MDIPINVLAKVSPAAIARELVDIQPISPCKLFDREYMEQFVCDWKPTFGEHWHSFAYGYQVFDGDEAIPRHEFIEKYGMENILKW